MEAILNVFIGYIIPAVILLGVLIFVHELGHLVAAKRVGVRVLKFSLGFGPAIWKKQIGETQYLLSIFPLGGYVKPLGESPTEKVPEEDLPYAMNTQSIPKRFVILVAGSLFNILFAVIVIAIIYMYGVPMLLPKVGAVLEDSPASHAGMQAGDLIEAINDRKIESWDDLTAQIKQTGGETVVFHVRRAEERKTVSVTPEVAVVTNIFGKEETTYRIGISASTSPDSFVTKRYNPFSALWLSLYDTATMAKLTIYGLGIFISSPVERKDDVGGPIMIGKLAGDFAQVSIVSFFHLLAIISISLGVLNLLPIPILDGGHIFFLGIEAIKGSPLSMKSMEIAQQVGLTLLLCLMLFVFYNDIMRFFS